MNARAEYQEMVSKTGTDSYTDQKLIDLHDRLVDAGSHDGIALCNCAITRTLFWRWYLEFTA